MASLRNIAASGITGSRMKWNIEKARQNKMLRDAYGEATAEKEGRGWKAGKWGTTASLLSFILPALGLAIPGVGPLASAAIISLMAEAGKRYGTRDIEESYDIEDALKGKDFAFRGSDLYSQYEQEIGNIGTEQREKAQAGLFPNLLNRFLIAKSGGKLGTLTGEKGFEAGLEEWLTGKSPEASDKAMSVVGEPPVPYGTTPDMLTKTLGMPPPVGSEMGGASGYLPQDAGAGGFNLLDLLRKAKPQFEGTWFPGVQNTSIRKFFDEYQQDEGS